MIICSPQLKQPTAPGAQAKRPASGAFHRRRALRKPIARSRMKKWGERKALNLPQPLLQAFPPEHPPGSHQDRERLDAGCTEGVSAASTERAPRRGRRAAPPDFWKTAGKARPPICKSTLHHARHHADNISHWLFPCLGPRSITTASRPATRLAARDRHDVISRALWCPVRPLATSPEF